MKEELERLYKAEYDLTQQLDQLNKKYNEAMSCLSTLATDKWARGQVLKYQECNVGELIDITLERIVNIK
jgi:hypothetical protein